MLRKVRKRKDLVGAGLGRSCLGCFFWVDGGCCSNVDSPVNRRRGECRGKIYVVDLECSGRWSCWRKKLGC